MLIESRVRYNVLWHDVRHCNLLPSGRHCFERQDIWSGHGMKLVSRHVIVADVGCASSGVG